MTSSVQKLAINQMRWFDRAARKSSSRGQIIAACDQRPALAIALEWSRTVLFASNERARTQRNAMIAFSVRCMSAALLYATQIVLARWMGSFEYGIFVFVWTWVLILGGLAHFGLNTVAMRMAPSYRASGQWALLRGLIGGGRWSTIATSTVISVLGACGLWLFNDALQGPYLLPLYLALVCVPMFALADIQDGIGRGYGWMDVSLIPPYIVRPLLLLLTMLAAHGSELPMTAATAAGAAIVATWLSTFVQTLILNRRLKDITPPGPAQYDFTRWFTTAMPLLVILACELMLQNTDILIISRYLSPTDVGIYFAAGKTMALILFVHYAVGSAVAHKFSELHALGDKAALKDFVRDAVNWTFWPSLAGALVILALGQPLLWLFGPQFLAGYPVMGILVLGFLVRSATGPAEYLLNMLGEQKICAMTLVVAAIMNVVLNLLLVPRYGMVGGAMATSTALAIAALMQAVAVSHRLGIDIVIWKNLPFRTRTGA